MHGMIFVNPQFLSFYSSQELINISRDFLSNRITRGDVLYKLSRSFFTARHFYEYLKR